MKVPTDEEMCKIVDKVIDYIATFDLNLASKYLLLRTLYLGFIETCKEDGLEIEIIEEENLHKK